jgi:putative transcriptional regulator
MERIDLVKNTREMLINAGFYVSDLHCINIPGFDLVARRDNSLLIVKVLANIDALSEDVADELKTLSKLLKGCPLLVGEKNGLGVLENDVVYFRFGIYALTLSTLKSHLLEGIPIKAYAAPGGFYVNLDEKKLRRLRQEQDVSLGSFARFVHVSRKTAQLYEQGMNARAEVASRIEELFDSVVTVPIDILKPPALDDTSTIPFYTARDSFEEFQRDIFSLLERVGYNVIPLDRCPFEAVSKDREKILLTCVHKYSKRLIQKAQIVSGISRITEKHAVLFTDKETGKTNVEGTPLIGKKVLKKMRDPEEIFELIIERIYQ